MQGLNIRVPSSTHKAIRAQAKLQGTSPGEIILGLLSVVQITPTKDTRMMVLPRIGRVDFPIMVLHYTRMILRARTGTFIPLSDSVDHRGGYIQAIKYLREEMGPAQLGLEDARYAVNVLRREDLRASHDAPI